MRLIGPEGDQLGIIPTEEALARAREQGLDLVEVSPTSRPPVCRILDYGKLKYELAKKDKLAKKKQHAFQMKEMRYRPKIDEHDFSFKTRHVREFIESGSKVKTFVMFRGREMAHTEFGQKVLERVAQELADVAIIEFPPKQEGRNMIMVLAPNQDVLKVLKSKGTKKVEKEHSDHEMPEKQENEVGPDESPEPATQPEEGNS